MNSKFKWGLATLIFSALIYRLVFNDSIASNFETPKGYAAPKSITRIEEEERIAFEKALAETDKKTTAVIAKSQERIQPIIKKRAISHVTKKELRIQKKLTSTKLAYRANKKPVRKLN